MHTSIRKGCFVKDRIVQGGRRPEGVTTQILRKQSAPMLDLIVREVVVYECCMWMHFGGDMFEELHVRSRHVEEQ